MFSSSLCGAPEEEEDLVEEELPIPPLERDRII
jgi:hypothetical protein